VAPEPPSGAPAPAPVPASAASPPDAAPAAARAPPAPDPLSLLIDESAEAYRLTVPVSHFVLTIRKGGLKKATNPRNRSPRYFLLQDKEHGTIVAGWFESAEHFDGLDKLWEHELSELKRRSSPDPQDVKFTKVGGWDAIVYQQPLPHGTSAHVRAEWVAEGTWIDLHLSMAGKRSAADPRATLLQLLEGFRVEDKD
jgi:hypothetical protein